MEAKKAAKVVQDAKTNARNQRRKKQRLMKKAQTLSADDLERIALLKRVGLWNPEKGLEAVEDAEAKPESACGSAASAGSASPAAAASSAGLTGTPTTPVPSEAAAAPETPGGDAGSDE